VGVESRLHAVLKVLKVSRHSSEACAAAMWCWRVQGGIHGGFGKISGNFFTTTYNIIKNARLACYRTVWQQKP